MILTGDKIKEYIKKNKLITNANIDNVHSSSYDVTTTDTILLFKKNDYAISLTDLDTIENLYEIKDNKNYYELKPLESIILPLQEEFNIPNNICAHLRGRTTFNRLGLNISSQHLNPGYQGKLNITLTNNSPNTYKILPNINIAQIVFESLTANVSSELLYNNEKTPYYQNEDGNDGAKIYGEFIGKVVRHYKGNYYYIENISMDSETKEYVIIYHNLYKRNDSNTWTRPAKMFFEPIDPNRKDNITKQHTRFEVVNEITKDYTSKD